jgi:hypothetical protein
VHSSNIEASDNSEKARAVERRERRAMIVLPLVGLIVIAALFFNVRPAQAYSCGSFCYGINLWDGSTNGAQTRDEVVSLTCQPASCKPGTTTPVPHIGNVLWLLDTTSSGCPQGACWIEVGYHTVTNAGGTSTVNQYYWADWRPGDTKLNVHPLANVASADLGNNVWLEIEFQGSNQWQIIAQPSSALYSGLSTNNTMHGNRIEIGMELAGTSGASANTGYFTSNEWQSVNNGSWNYQSSSGTHISQAPTNSGWLHPPAGASNLGGTFSTGCVC